MMDTNTTRREIFQIIADLFAVDYDELHDSIGPGDLLSWNSVGHLRLILKVENQFNIRLMVNEVLSITSIKDIVDVITVKGSGDSNVVPTGQKYSLPDLRLPKKIFYDSAAMLDLEILHSGLVAVITGNSNSSRANSRKITELIPDSIILTRLTGEPTISTIIHLAETLKKHQFVAIIAVGGGSTIDSAKMARLFKGLSATEITQHSIDKTIPATTDLPYLIAVQTLPGSGAEVSSAAILMQDNISPKNIVLDDRLLPDSVVLEQIFTETVPLPLIVTGCFDALSHAIEGFASIVKQPQAEAIALTCTHEISSILTNLTKGGDISTQSAQLLNATDDAGIVQNHCSVGGCHALAHASAAYGIPHAVAITLFLPFFLKLAVVKSHNYQRVLQAISAKSSMSAINQLDEWQTSLGFRPAEKLISAIVNNRLKIVETALTVTAIDTNPFSLKKSDLLTIIDTMVKRWR